MIKLDPYHLLYIEPTQPPSEEPVDDEYVKRYKEILENHHHVDENIRYRGVHKCSCGVVSDNRVHYVNIDDRIYKTHSLALHYLQHHRSEIPAFELDKIVRTGAIPLVGKLPDRVQVAHAFAVLINDRELARLLEDVMIVFDDNDPDTSVIVPRDELLCVTQMAGSQIEEHGSKLMQYEGNEFKQAHAVKTMWQKMGHKHIARKFDKWLTP